MSEHDEKILQFNAFRRRSSLLPLSHSDPWQVQIKDQSGEHITLIGNVGSTVCIYV